MKTTAAIFATIAFTATAAQYEPVQRTKDATGTITQNVDFTGTTKINGTNISTFSFSTPAQGEILYYDGSNWVNLAVGTSGQFLKSNGASANVSWDVPAGAGDVVGPASAATDNAVVRYDSTTGKLIQNSTVTIDDAGNISTSGTVDGIDISQLDADAIKDETYDAQTIIVAVSDDTPVVTTVAESQLVGRPTGGNVGVVTAAQARTILNVEDDADANWTTVTQGTAEAGTSTTEYSWTPERVKQAIAALESTRTGVYRTLWLAAGAFAPRTTNGAEFNSEEYATNDIQVDTALFDGATGEAVFSQIVMPDEWNRGTVKVKIYWDGSAGASAADGVAWDISAGALSDDDAIDAALGTAQTVTDSVIAVGDVHITSATAALTIGGSPALGDFVLWRVARDPANAGDTMAEDAKLLGVLIQYAESATEPSAW